MDCDFCAANQRCLPPFCFFKLSITRYFYGFSVADEMSNLNLSSITFDSFYFLRSSHNARCRRRSKGDRRCCHGWCIWKGRFHPTRGYEFPWSWYGYYVYRKLVIKSRAYIRSNALFSSGLKRCLEEMAEGGKMVKMAKTEEVWAVPKNLLKRLIVVEVWPEKKNVAIVGNGKYQSISISININDNGAMKNTSDAIWCP